MTGIDQRVISALFDWVFASLGKTDPTLICWVFLNILIVIWVFVFLLHVICSLDLTSRQPDLLNQKLAATQPNHITNAQRHSHWSPILLFKRSYNEKRFFLEKWAICISLNFIKIFGNNYKKYFLKNLRGFLMIWLTLPERFCYFFLVYFVWIFL